MMKKTAENNQNLYVAVKRIFSKLSIPNLIARIEDLNEDCVKISHPYLLYFPRNKPSKSVSVGFAASGFLRILSDYESRRR